VRAYLPLDIDSLLTEHHCSAKRTLSLLRLLTHGTVGNAVVFAQTNLEDG
jgi:hypothetical protein